MRIRIVFAKTTAMRFTGHLDLHRAWERTLRRAGLPLSYSQGFNPHPKINLGAALPLGLTSENDLVDVWLECSIPLSEIEAALGRAVPPGISLTSIQEIDERAPTLQAIILSSNYVVTFLEPIPELKKRLAELLAQEKLPRIRRNKDYDLRPLIVSAEVMTEDGMGRQRLFLRLSARPGATGRPEEVVYALGNAALPVLIHREGLVLQEDASCYT